jgi:hypothetical protein
LFADVPSVESRVAIFGYGRIVIVNVVGPCGKTIPIGVSRSVGVEQIQGAVIVQITLSRVDVCPSR